jgi:hypothetical protein
MPLKMANDNATSSLPIKVADVPVDRVEVVTLQDLGVFR